MRSLGRRLRRDDTGFSLAELTVSMLVSTLVAAAAAVMFDVALKSNTATEARLDAINESRVAVESMSRSLRTAVLPRQLEAGGTTATAEAAFLQADGVGVSFYANINNPGNTIGPSRVTYTISATGDLVQTIQQPDRPLPASRNYTYCDPAVATCKRSTRLLASRVDARLPLFTYYDQYGLAMPYGANCAGRPCLTASELEVVDAVEVRVVVRAAPKAAVGPTSYVTRVALPNHDSIVPEGSTS